jgi:hypothetical protein
VLGVVGATDGMEKPAGRNEERVGRSGVMDVKVLNEFETSDGLSTPYREKRLCMVGNVPLCRARDGVPNSPREQ